MSVVAAREEVIAEVSTAIEQAKSTILEKLDWVKTQYTTSVIEEQGLLGKKADQLTAWFTDFHSQHKTRTAAEMDDFKTQFVNQARAILAAGGNL